MKNFLRVIAFCSLLNVKLILSAAKETFIIEIKFVKVARTNNLDTPDSIEILGSDIENYWKIKIKKNHSLTEIPWMNSLGLLNEILNTNLIKQKQAVNHNWNQENLKFALRNCSNMQAIKRSLFLINYFNKENNQNNLFQKTIESCSYFLDTLSRDLVPKDNVKTDYSNINKSAQKLYANITQETNQPGMPFYFRYPFFGYYYIKFIELFTSLKNYTMSKVFRISSTDKNDDILIIDKLEENSNDETKYEIRDSESFDSWSSRSDDEDLLANVYP